MTHLNEITTAREQDALHGQFQHPKPAVRDVETHNLTPKSTLIGLELPMRDSSSICIEITHQSQNGLA